MNFITSLLLALWVFPLGYSTASDRHPFLTCALLVDTAPELVLGLIESDDFVTEVLEEISDSGEACRGVYRVRTRDDSTLALKVVTRNPVPQSLAIHSYLASLTYAPRLRGTVSHAALLVLQGSLEEKYHAPILKSKLVRGLLMEEIEEGWNLPKSRRPIPTHARDWDRRKIFERLDEMEGALNRARIELLDLQFLISKDGVIYFIDLDAESRQVPLDEEFILNDFSDIKIAYDEKWAEGKIIWGW